MPAPADPDPYRRQPWLASYPPSVPHRVDVPRLSLPGLLDEAAGRGADAVALVGRGSAVTYGDLRARVERLAGALAGLGVGRGDRVALVLPDGPPVVVAALAALRLGAVLVPLDPRSSPAALGRRLAETGATVAVCVDGAHGDLTAAGATTALRHVLVTAPAPDRPRRLGRLRLPGLSAARGRRARTLVPAGDRVHRLDELVGRASGSAPAAELDPERDVALLAFTDEGERAAVLPHRALVAGAAQALAWLPGAGDVVLSALPVWHPHGVTLGLTATLLRGGRLVLPADPAPSAVLAAVEAHRPTRLLAAPALVQALLGLPGLERHDLAALDAVVVVGPPLPDALVERFERGTGARLVAAYGPPETAALTHAQPSAGPRRPGSLGLPLPGTRARLVDPADPRRAVPAGVPGLLAVTGPQLPLGWWRRPDETRAAVTPDGHHVTGDLAVMDPDGVFTLLDGPAAPERGGSVAASGTLVG